MAVSSSNTVRKLLVRAVAASDSERAGGFECEFESESGFECGFGLGAEHAPVRRARSSRMAQKRASGIGAPSTAMRSR